VQECDAKIEALLAPLQQHKVKLKASRKGKGKNNPAFDVRQAMANHSVNHNRGVMLPIRFPSAISGKQETAQFELSR